MRNKRFPNYPDDADYTTNANSYYDDLARKEKLIRLLAERIWGYEKILDDTLEEIQERFRAWDKNLEDFPDDVKILLQQWLDNGTLDHIINDTIFNWKLDTTIFEQFRDVTTPQLQQLLKQQDGLEVNVTTLGIKPNDGIDYTPLLKQLIATGVDIVMPSGTYKITDELNFKHGQSLRTVGKVVLDGTDFIGTSGRNIIKVDNSGDPYIGLPTLQQNLTKGGNTLTFATSHNLVIGDIICIYDNVPNSFSSARASYKKGEFCKVSQVISHTSIMVDSPLFDNYDVSNINLGVYRMNMGEFVINGELEIIQGKTGNYKGITMHRVKNSDFRNIKAYVKNGAVKAIELDQCFNITINGVAECQKTSGLGIDYGLMISNSQHIRGDLYASSPQHALSTGGYDGIGAIPVRDVQFTGVLKGNILDIPTYALGLHGNTENFVFDGSIYGGAMLAGKSTKIKGTVYSNKKGICVIFNDMLNFEHDISNLSCISHANPAPSGVVDFGGTGMADVDYMSGGTLDLSNIKINGSLAKAGIVIRMRNPNADLNSERLIDLRGAKINVSQESDALTTRIQDVAGVLNFKQAVLSGCDYNGGVGTLSNIDNLIPYEKYGVSDITLNTTVNSVTKKVFFDKAYPIAVKPIVNANITSGLVVGIPLELIISNTKNDSFDATLRSLNGDNFTLDTNVNITYKAH